MAITKPPVLPSWAEAGDKVQPSNAEIQAGWPLSSIPPSRQRFNWLLNFLANGIRYFSRRGLPDYDADETYMTGDRIIGDDGKTYRSLIDNNTAQTPSTSPTKWERWGFTFDEFLAGVATPPQFDNDTSVATTEFVQRALGSTSGYAGLTNGQALNASAIGKLHNISTGVTSVTLPDLAGLPLGAAVSFINTSQADCTISRAGTNTLAINNSVVNSLVVKNGDSITFIKATASLWFAIGTAALQGSDSFGKSLAGSGYQRLPSGLIVQWGVNTTSGGGASVTFPIAFPNAVLAVIASVNSANTNRLVSTGAFLLTGFPAYVFNASAGTNTDATFDWVAFGR